MAIPSMDELIELLCARSLVTGSFTLSSGRSSGYYIDARKTTMSAAGLNLVGQLGLAAIREEGWEPELVGGMTLGADPVAHAIALASLRSPPAIDAFTVRRDQKEYGTKGLIEGCLTAGAKVVVVEDVITTAGSALRAVEAIQAAGAETLGVLAVVDREEGGREAIEHAGRAFRALVTAHDLGVAG